MRRVEPHLQAVGYRIKLISLTGGLQPTANSITDLQDKMATISVEPGTTVMFDILGNFTYRYEQEDRGMLLPVPIQGVHHMFGKVGVCTDDMFKGVVTKLVSVLGQLSPVPCVVLLPVPRYLTGGCCNDRKHASNTKKTGEDSAMIEKLMRLRKLLRTELDASKCTNYWVPDVLEHLSATAVGGSGKIPTAEGALLL